MILAYNFESTVYRPFCELAQYLLSGKHSFSKLCLKVRTKALILKKHIVLTCEWKFYHAHEPYSDTKT